MGRGIYVEWESEAEWRMLLGISDFQPKELGFLFVELKLSGATS